MHFNIVDISNLYKLSSQISGGPKLKNNLFALYRPYLFGLGRSVGKMFYFFQALSLKKVGPAKQLVCTCM